MINTSEEDKMERTAIDYLKKMSIISFYYVVLKWFPLLRVRIP